MQNVGLGVAAGMVGQTDVGAKLAFELEQQTLSGFFANPGYLDQPPGFLQGDRLRQLGHAEPGEHGQGRARPHARDFDELAKSFALWCSGETIQNLGVFAHHKMGQQAELMANFWQVVKSAHGHLHLVAHAMILRHLFSPLNNVRLSHLCGPMDQHLRSIEAALKLKIAHRHEQFKVDGPKLAAQRGMEMLQALYEMAARPIEPATVQLMLAGDSAAGPQSGPGLQTRRADLRARTPNQALYLDNIAAQDITFGIGPAGTGKTYLAVAMAVDALQRNAVQRIVLTRPAVEAGERLGFLPGDLSQKVDPYLRPLYDALYELMGVEQVHKAFERSALEVAPLAFMRGRTLNNAFVILDEAQNTTPEQMKMFLTRIGFGSKAVVTGDVSQIDLPKTQLSGLIDAERVLRRVQGIAICRFTSADVVRHPLVARIVDAYDAPNRPASKKSA